MIREPQVRAVLKARKRATVREIVEKCLDGQWNASDSQRVTQYLCSWERQNKASRILDGSRKCRPKGYNHYADIWELV